MLDMIIYNANITTIENVIVSYDHQTDCFSVDYSTIKTSLTAFKRTFFRYFFLNDFQKVFHRGRFF